MNGNDDRAGNAIYLLAKLGRLDDDFGRVDGRMRLGVMLMAAWLLGLLGRRV